MTALAAYVGRKDQQVVAVRKPRGGIADEGIAIEIGGNRGMQAIVVDERTERRKADRQRAEQLAQGSGFDFDGGGGGALARNAQKFNLHGAPGDEQRT